MFLVVFVLTSFLLFLWVSGTRLLVFLVLLEFIIFLSALFVSPMFSLGGEVLTLFIISGGVLSMLLLVVTSLTRKFGAYSSEACEYKLYSLSGSYPESMEKLLFV